MLWFWKSSWCIPFLVLKWLQRRVKDKVPTSYGKKAVVKNWFSEESVTKIRGTVENSIIFRDVVVEEGAVVRNSIILQIPWLNQVLI